MPLNIIYIFFALKTRFKKTNFFLMKTNLKNQLSTWLPQVLLIIALNFIYFYPVLQGKILNQNDIIMGQIKGQEVVDYRAEHGEEPLWRTHLFSGMPELTLFPTSIFTYASKLIEVLGGSGTYIIAVFMLGFFFFARSNKLDPWIAFLGAIAVGFSAFFIISVGAGHNAKVRTAAYIAPILLGILLTYRGKVLVGLVVTSFFVGLSIFSNHIQVTYYTFLCILALITTYGVFAFKNKTFPDFIKKSIFLALAAVVGVGPNIGKLWTNYVNMKETMRGGGSELTLKEQTNPDGLNYDYAMSWSYGIGETLNLVYPYAQGGGSRGDYTGTETYETITSSLKSQGYPAKKAEEIATQNTGSMLYWGDQTMVNGAYYMGASVFFLFVFAFLIVKSKAKYWVTASIIISLILAWGKNIEPISHFIFDYLPFYDKFRVPSMALTVTLVLVPFMAVLGLNEFYKNKESKEFYKKKLIRAIAICGGFGIVWWILGSTTFSFAGMQDDNFKQYINLDTLIDDRKSLFTTSIFKSTFIMAITFGILWFYNTKTLKPIVFISALAALILFDLWSFDKDQLNADDFISERKVAQMATMSSANQLIAKDSDPHFRVWNTTVSLTGDYLTPNFHESLGGLHASKLARYQDIIDYQLSKGNMPTVNMLNTKWVIVQDQQSNQPVAQPNRGALGNAWFVNEVVIAANADKEMTLLDDFDPANQVVVNQEFENYVAGLQLNPEGSTVELTGFDNKKLDYKVNIANGEQFIVFSEIYYAPKYQAWKAYLDGKEVEHIRVNYLLRGMKVPAGAHTITFKFEPETYFMGAKIDLAFSILLLLGAAVVIYLEMKSKKERAA